MTESDLRCTDPVAFFLTWPTYGTWLPGDRRGWVEYHHGWQLPQPKLAIDCASRMTEDACRLSDSERTIVTTQIAETCEHRGWLLHAVDCRSNHVHVVISASNVIPKKRRIDLKAWCTRKLKQQSMNGRLNWWAERGSIRYLWDMESLETVVRYVTEAQDQKDRDVLDGGME